MIQEFAAVQSVTEIASNIFQLSFRSPAISANAVPGQFVNVRVEDSTTPLLRRPFSIFFVEGTDVSIIFNVIGHGTGLLSKKTHGEMIDVLGPLGRGVFPFDDNSYATALLVAGGLGVAAFPFLHSRMPRSKNVVSFLGARNSSQIVRSTLTNVHVATDDGSEGYHGTVVELFEQFVDDRPPDRPRIFSCGPLPMMRALADVARNKDVPCYLALECEMACGIGLCQGCPVETISGIKKYNLVCKDGPVFEASRVNF